MEDRNEEQYLDRRFGLNPRTDYLVGLLPVLLAYYGPAGLPVAVVMLAVVFAIAESFLRRRATAIRLVMAVGMAQCVLLYEAGPAIYVTSGRGVLLLSAGLWTWQRLAALARRHLPAPEGPRKVRTGVGSRVGVRG